MATALMTTIPCTKCDNPIAKFHCDTCAKALCLQCKAIHLEDRATRHHVVVEYAKKLDPKYLAALVCHSHNTSDPDFWCNTCDVPICISCITEKHNGHNFSKITIKLSEKRDEMLEETKALRDQTVGQWEEVLKQAKRITTDYIANIDEIDTELKARAKEMQKQVDIILSQSQQVLQQLKASGLDKLRKQEKYLSDRIEKLKAEVQRYEDRLLEADSNALLQFRPGTKQPKEQPPSLETATVPRFMKGPDDANAMQRMFGKLSTEGLSASNEPSPSTASTQAKTSSDSRKTMVTSTQPSPSSATRKSLIPSPSFQFQFYVDYSYPRLACVQGGLAWVKTGANKLQLVDREGSVKDTSCTDFDFYGITVTSDGDLILPDYNNKCIKSISTKKKISTLFMTSGIKPYSLCILQSNDIVVAFNVDSKVIVYRGDGQIKQTLDQIKFKYPLSVAMNKLNQDIYICDHKANSHYSLGKVIAVGADGQLRYEYSGQGDKVFAPVDVCTDQMGHVLITDGANHRVHILDQEGRFIQYILTSQQGLKRSYAIDTDNEEYVWVGRYISPSKGQVNVARYLR